MTTETKYELSLLLAYQRAMDAGFAGLAEALAGELRKLASAGIAK
jgi:hypothetical protein